VTTHHKFFSDKSDLYASARPTYPAALYEFLRVQCEDLENCWDCATGTGQAAIALADIFDHVEASDVSAEQVAHAVAHARVNYSVQAAEKTDYADHSFDLITVAQALHWFDFQPFWLEVDRVLKPGGVFATWFYSWFRINDEIDAVIQSHLLDVIEPYWAAQNRLAWDHYREVDFPLAEIPAPTIPLNFDWQLDQVLAYVGTWSATRRCLDKQGDGFFDEFVSAMYAAWGSPLQTRQVEMDFFVKVGRKQI
jgi:SAM-dependent methyltransferase